MSSLEIVPPEGTTARALRDGYFFAAARRVGDLLILSGQTGHRLDLSLPETAPEQIEIAFDNVGEILAAADLTWDEVVSVRSYHVVPAGADSIPEDSFTAVHGQLGTRMPNHYPVWSAIPVPALSLRGMLIEVEVTAHASGELQEA